MGFCAMFPAEKSAMSSAVVLLSSLISAIHYLPRSLTTPLGDVRSPSVYRYGHKHACRISPSLHVTAAPPRVGVTPQDTSRAAYHTRTPERAPYRGGKRGVPWLHTICGARCSMPHRVSTPQ